MQNMYLRSSQFLTKGETTKRTGTKIREKLVQKGEELYNAIKDSGV